MVRRNQIGTAMALHRLPAPTKCHLWNAPERLHEVRFDTVVVFDEEDHYRRRLVKCPDCGQLYLQETPDETAADLACTYIPVPTEEHGAALALAAHASLMRVRPLLREEFPDGQTAPQFQWWPVEA
jgi:hypothetical protein